MKSPKTIVWVTTLVAALAAGYLISQALIKPVQILVTTLLNQRLTILEGQDLKWMRSAPFHVNWVGPSPCTNTVDSVSASEYSKTCQKLKIGTYSYFLTILAEPRKFVALLQQGVPAPGTPAPSPPRPAPNTIVVVCKHCPSPYLKRPNPIPGPYPDGHPTLAVASTGESVISVYCDSGNHAVAYLPEDSQTSGSPVEWQGLGEGNPDWSVTTPANPPACTNATSFDKTNTVCSTGQAGTYPYAIKIAGCQDGTGTLKIKAQDNGHQ
jgi:hypothetical protein